MTNRAIAVFILMLVGSLSAQSALSQERNSAGGPLASNPVAPDLASDIPSYIIADVRSFEGSTNVATAIKITNLSGRTCNYSVSFFFGHAGPTCTMNIGGVTNGLTSYFCSRDIPDTWGLACDAICNPELTSYDGKAFIFSTKVGKCERMAISATIYNSTSDDSEILATRTPAIVKRLPSVAPWTTRGD
jgi:hypothetical protein